MSTDAKNIFLWYFIWVLLAMRRYSSGQRGQTVNLLTSVSEGSNPSRRTNILLSRARSDPHRAFDSRFLFFDDEISCFDRHIDGVFVFNAV